MVRQKKAPAARRRPMSREEALARQERQQRRRELEQESRELAKGPIDLPFFILVMLLTGVGLVMLLSASFPSAYYETDGQNPMFYFIRQGVFAIMGVAAMLFIGKINYQRFRGLAKPLMYLSIVLLVLVILPGPNAYGKLLGIRANNAVRWLGIPGTSFQFQPSEIAKLAVVIYFADSISKKKDRMQTFRYGIAPYAVLLIVLAALVGIEPHLSGAILIMGAGAVMMLVGGIHWRWVGLAMGAAGLLLYLVLGVIGYNATRIEMWHNPWLDPRGAGYQLRQSLITIGSGGLWGVGLGKSRQKFLYLPEEHNDFIFAIVCEELGLIGATVIMLLFAALILRGFWIALHARDRFGSLMVVGVMTLVGLQTFLNIGVVTGLLPTTGISLPFFSYGGTALSIQLAEMGIVLSVSRQMKPTKAG
ncbi:MAG: putative lipid II flippase FtsW [Oscillibacter sp.]|uniref:putative lipid II flippase FtsW n=1 Tax=Oscillibacter sp. TaxID=1945593 RepID=UPI001DB39B6C|nr:putative lipid II flippase FtsW [Oscillibacter sp.]MBS6290340.1 putative lipid II flippase FtsW [Oscillibacter sp.]